MTVSEAEKSRRARLSERVQYALEERDDRWRQALSAVGVKIDLITSSVVRFHDERGSRPFSTPIEPTSPVPDFAEIQTLQALQRDIARMRGLRLMEILSEEWTIDRLDDGQRELLAAAMHRLSAHVDGAITVAVDALMVDPSKARAILSDAPFKHIALAVAKERLFEIKGMEAKVALLPDEVPPKVWTCSACGSEFVSQRAVDMHEYGGECDGNYDSFRVADRLSRRADAPCTCEAPRERGPERLGAIDGHEGPCLSRAAAFYEARR